MKQRDLIKKLEAAGFTLKRHGGNHDVLGNCETREVRSQS